MRLAITQDAAALLERCARLNQKVAGMPRAFGPMGMSPMGERSFARLGATAMIPIDGPIWFAPSMFSLFWGGTTVGGIGAAIAAAGQESGVEQILLDVHSPGGDAAGMDELSRAVANSPVPVHVFCHDDCCSMAYVLAAAARKSGGTVFGSPTCAVGSIGVYAGIYDTAGQAEKEGVRPVFRTTGKAKMGGLYGVPVSPEVEAELDRGVLAASELFWKLVEDGRGIAIEQQQAWQGAVFHGEQAVTAGLIDKVVAVDALYERMATAQPVRRESVSARVSDVRTKAMHAGVTPGTSAETSMTNDELKKALAEMDPAEREALLAEYMPEEEETPEPEAKAPEAKAPVVTQAKAATLAELDEAISAKLPDRDGFITRALRGGWSVSKAQAAALDAVLEKAQDQTQQADAAVAQAAKGGTAIGGGTVKGDAPKDWDAAVTAAVASGKSRVDAVRFVNTTYPELRTAKFGR